MEGSAVWVEKAIPCTVLDLSDARQFEYLGQLTAYAEAIGAATDKKCLGSWVHFPVTGRCVKMSSLEAAERI